MLLSFILLTFCSGVQQTANTGRSLGGAYAHRQQRTGGLVPGKENKLLRRPCKKKPMSLFKFPAK
jgi:hypothetical protein